MVGGRRDIKSVESTCSILQHSDLITHPLPTGNDNNKGHEKKTHTNTHTA